MFGKKVKLNDYKFTYGQETININIYSAFKNKKSGNKYVIYSYDNNETKLFYGVFYQRDKEAVIMKAKEDQTEIIKEFINNILETKTDDKYEIISLEKIETVQVIEEHSIDFNVDIKKLHELTIPKPVIESPKEEKKEKKPISISWIFFSLFVIVVIAFFFVNPEVIIGKNRYYNCTKIYFHNILPATINEEVLLTFNGKGNIISIEKIIDYKFSDIQYYKEFKEKSYFYQYIDEGDTYKFIDTNYTYRLFSNINIEEDYFLPEKESQLISYYQDNNYNCKVVDKDE